MRIGIALIHFDAMWISHGRDWNGLLSTFGTISRKRCCERFVLLLAALIWARNSLSTLGPLGKQCQHHFDYYYHIFMGAHSAASVSFRPNDYYFIQFFFFFLHSSVWVWVPTASPYRVISHHRLFFVRPSHQFLLGKRKK